jgi:hypothetical protein
MQAIDFFHIIPWIVNRPPFIQPSPEQPFSFTGLESIVTPDSEWRSNWWNDN